MKIQATLSLCVVVAAMGACTLESPFEGPGYELGTGLTTSAEGPFVASTTDLILSDTEGAQAAFDEHMAVLSDAITSAPGLVGYSLGLPILNGGGYRTLTVWETEEDMVRWVSSEANVAAMVDFGENDFADGASAVASWSISAEDMPPTWEQANAELKKNGRTVY